MTALADVHESAQRSEVVTSTQVKAFMADKANSVVAKRNDGSNTAAKAASASKSVQWKRPAGQFWGVGYDATINNMGYYFTPLVLRPWTEYTFQNMSTATGTPAWQVQAYDGKTGNYATTTYNDQDLTVSYIRYETPVAPTLEYKTLGYPIQYYGKTPTGKDMNIAVNNTLNAYMDGDVMPVSSHYWGLFTREAVDRSGFLFYTGAQVYEGMDEDNGCWFGTNNQGINAMATRFEKPDQPYLLNGVYYYYQMANDIPNDIPVKAYVFKTVNDAAADEDGVEGVELGELIAVAESVIPATVFDEDNNFSGAAEFKFIEKNPVTGATSNVSLEISDDITIVVTGFNADLGNGGYLTTFLSTDTFDEGYGNLGFLGALEEGEDGSISYRLTALKNFFQSPLHNTTLGVLADVSYPWISDYYLEQPTSVKFANEGETTDDFQGLQYALMNMSTSETSDYEITFNGEEECEWLSVVDVYDEYEENEAGEEEFTGVTGLEFEAAPNPNDETRVCKVKISIPAASYEITFLQGSKAEDPGSVGVVTVEGETQYFDLAGRRVVNPEKGIYVKVNGNKAEKVVL